MGCCWSILGVWRQQMPSSEVQGCLYTACLRGAVCSGRWAVARPAWIMDTQAGKTVFVETTWPRDALCQGGHTPPSWHHNSFSQTGICLTACHGTLCAGGSDPSASALSDRLHESYPAGLETCTCRVLAGGSCTVRFWQDGMT